MGSNTYVKYAPNVFLAKCSEQHKKGDIISVTTKYGKENESIVFNLIYEEGGFYFYSIIRADGYNAQERAKRKAERLSNAATNAEKKSNKYWEASQEGKDFLVLAEPIKIGHHSEKRHRALIERNHNRMRKSVEFYKKSEGYESRAEYWEKRTDVINLSMPESIEYYSNELDKASEYHAGLKSGKYERSHSMSLSYALKAVKELQEKYSMSIRLWA